MRRHLSIPGTAGGVLGVCMLALTAFMTACQPFATFPQDGSGPRVYPWMAPGPEVMATGLLQAHARVAPEEELVFNLPAGVSNTAWNDVQDRLGPDARRMTPDDKVVWSLERYGIRNTTAFADISYWNKGTGILVTVSMERENIAPFKVTHVQRWYVSIEEPMCNNPAYKAAGDTDSSTDDASTAPETAPASDATSQEGAGA